MRMFAMVVVFGVLVRCVIAGEIGETEALEVARAWQEGQTFAGVSEMGVPKRAERHMTVAGASFYIVPFSRRGYLVVSGDDGVEPIIAFSSAVEAPTGDSTLSPLFGVLSRDLAGRSRDGSPKWSRLRRGTVAKLPKAASSELSSVADMRVEPLIGSNWGQKTDTGYSNTGNPCYNLYTPNNAPCGCGATAMAQVLRFWQYPVQAPAGQYLCSVNGNDQYLTISAGFYDWANMPLGTNGGVGETQRQAIGKLTYDCAVALHSHFHSGSAYSYSDFAFTQLVETFGYSSAVGYCPVTVNGIHPNEIRSALFASLDFGSPVLLSLMTADDIGHQAIADGYGFVDGTEYVHLNLGWNSPNDASDVWYSLPDVTTDSYAFTMIDGMIYNIFPQVNGDVLSGRVVDVSGAPLANVMVRAKTATSSGTASVMTNDRGIYAFLLEGGRSYVVTCGAVTKTVSLPKSVSAVCNWSDPLYPTFYPDRAGTCGNSWGNDFVYCDGQPEGDESGEITPGAFTPTKAVSGVAPYCGALYEASGTVCGTITLKVGKPSKKGVSKVSGTIMLLDGSKYAVKSTDFATSEVGPVTVRSIEIKKLGTLDLTVGNNGFTATIRKTDGSVLTGKTADFSQGLPVGKVTFSVAGLPQTIDGSPVLTDCSADGQVISVSAKGKLDCGKAASVKYKKITEKDPVTGVKTSRYELQGLDDPLKPNRSGLKLTYTAKTAMFKGSFGIYVDVGTAEKPKLKKLSASVVGFVIGGKGVGTATVKKVGSWTVTVK